MRSLGGSPLTTGVCLDSPLGQVVVGGRHCLASVTRRTGRRQQDLAASCKPLISSHLTIIKAALKSEQWQMQAQGEGLLHGTEDPPELLSHVCTFL